MVAKFASFTSEEIKAVERILDRIHPILRRALKQDAPSRLDLMMDLSATHALLPIDLVGLAEAEDYDLSHDVCGIVRHLDRETGVMGDCFVPRYARNGGGS